MTSHASVPFAEPVEGDLFRIYFSPRDRDNRSYAGWLELDITRPNRILRLAETPLLAPGAPGSFDDRGAMPSWVVTTDEHRYIYYVGWNLRSPVPFHVSIGLATGPGGDPAVVHMNCIPGPVLERSPADPWFCSNPCVLRDGTHWRMWYLSGLGWETIGGRLSASYHIRQAVSDDGIVWQTLDAIAIGLAPGEFAIARPAVLRDAHGYTMWFCARGREKAYRLGSARSADGITWTRDDRLADLLPAETGWDSEMIAYPHVFDHRGKRYMLYCGGGFGRTGFGLAAWA